MRTRHTPCEKDPVVETSWKGPGHAMPQRSPRDLPASQAFVERARKQDEAKNGVHYSIPLDGTLVGVMGFVYVDRSNRNCEMGYESAFRKGPAPARSPRSKQKAPWIAQSCQGRGIVTKATVALTDYAFLVWDMNRVEIRAQAAATRCPSQPASLDR
jgi:ribosomal-protein-serine acetyltransferase